MPNTSPQTANLPDVHPGTPANARVILTLQTVRESAKATLVKLPGGEREVWIPRSVATATSVNPQAAYRCDFWHLPVWFFRKVRTQF
jgi:hypothetical protein